MAAKKVKRKSKVRKKVTSRMPKLPKEIQAALNKIPHLVAYQKELQKHFSNIAKQVDTLVKNYKKNPMRIFSKK